MVRSTWVRWGRERRATGQQGQAAGREIAYNSSTPHASLCHTSHADNAGKGIAKTPLPMKASCFCAAWLRIDWRIRLPSPLPPPLQMVLSVKPDAGMAGCGVSLDYGGKLLLPLRSGSPACLPAGRQAHVHRMRARPMHALMWPLLSSVLWPVQWLHQPLQRTVCGTSSCAITNSMTTPPSACYNPPLRMLLYGISIITTCCTPPRAAYAARACGCRAGARRRIGPGQRDQQRGGGQARQAGQLLRVWRRRCQLQPPQGLCRCRMLLRDGGTA